MLQIPPPESFQSHLLFVALPVILATAAGQMLSYFANRKRGKDKDNRLAMLLEEYRLHEHEENAGALQAENIRYPRSGQQEPK
jgi:hypothetical protein